MRNLILPKRLSSFYNRKGIITVIVVLVFFYIIFNVILSPNDSEIINFSLMITSSPIFIAFFLLAMYEQKNSFRCKICNQHIRKREHSLYCTSCRGLARKIFEYWKGKIICNLCCDEFDAYDSFEDHFKRHSEKPWIRYHSEDNAIRKII